MAWQRAGAAIVGVRHHEILRRREEGRRCRRELGGVANRIGRGCRHQLPDRCGTGHGNAKAGVAAAVSGDIRGAEESLTFRDAIHGIGIAGVELDAERRVGRDALHQRAADRRASPAHWSRRIQDWEILEVIGVIGRAVALGVIGGNAVVLGESEAVGQVDPQQEGWVAPTVFEDAIFLNGVADVRLPRHRHGVAEDGDATSAIELDQVAGTHGGATDEVVLHTRFVWLPRTQWRRQTTVAAQDDAVQVVADGGDAVGADAGEVALDDVALATVIDLDAGAVEADDVAGAGHRTADRVVVAARDLDAEKEVTGGRAGDWTTGLDPHRARAGRVGADVVVFDQVGRRRGDQGAVHLDAVSAVARDDVACRRRGAADGITR